MSEEKKTGKKSVNKLVNSKIASSYRRIGEKQYLVFSGSACEVGRTYQMAMAGMNPMEGILPADYEYLDDQIRENIDITELTPITELAGKLKKKHAEIIYREILKAMEQTEEFLLNPEHLLIEPQYLYWDTETERTGICFVPFYECSLKTGLERVTDWLLAGMAKEDQEGILMLCRIRHTLDAPQLHGEEIRRIIFGDTEVPVAEESICDDDSLFQDELWDENAGREIRVKGLPDRNVRIVVLGGLLVSACVYLLLHSERLDPVYRIIFLALLGSSFAGLLIYGFLKRRSDKKNKNKVVSAIRESQDSVWTDRKYSDRQISEAPRTRHTEDTAELPGIETFLRTGPTQEETEEENCDCLIAEDESVSGPRKIRLSGRRMLIGKNTGYADIVLTSSAVSRLHACLFQKDGIWYVRDLLSVNGTFADGSILESGTEHPLSDGTRLAFADCRYRASLEKTAP